MKPYVQLCGRLEEDRKVAQWWQEAQEAQGAQWWQEAQGAQWWQEATGAQCWQVAHGSKRSPNALCRLSWNQVEFMKYYE